MNTNDFGAAGRLLADDYRLEWPQSGEVVRGRDKFAALNPNYPAHGPWRFSVQRLVTEGNEVVSYVHVTDGTVEAQVTTFSTGEGGLIVRQLEFWPDPFRAPDWRRAWVERV